MIYYNFYLYARNQWMDLVGELTNKENSFTTYPHHITSKSSDCRSSSLDDVPYIMR